MQGIDIRPLKKRLREEVKGWRRGLPAEKKAEADADIRERFLRLREYEECRALLCYVSLPIEVDTIALIGRALQDGKIVAVPRCVPGTREMEFYRIRSLEDLAPQAFGVLEPVPERCELFLDWEGSACVVPALAYDLSGYRLGYGAGYYDRFLSKYPGKKIGLTYEKNLLKHLWHGRYDVAVDIVVHEQALCICTRKRENRRKRRLKG